MPVFDVAKQPNRSPALIATSAGLAVTILLASLAGCSTAPWEDDADHARSIAPERVKQIDRTTFAEQRRETPSEDAATLAKRRFLNVEQVELSLEECRMSALQHNLDLRVSLVDPAIAREQEAAEEAKFESAFTLRTLWAESDQATTLATSSSQSNRQSIEPGVRIPLRTGGTASVSLPMARNKQDNPFSTLNESYSSDLQFSLSHELLRNAGRRANTAQLRIAGYNRQSSQAQTKLEAIRQLAAVDRSYWRLYQAKRLLEVRQQQYELASVQLERAQRRFKAGAVAEIEVIRAEGGISDRLEGIILAQNDVLTQQRELKRIINTPGLTIDTTTMVTPSTQPDPVRYEFDTKALASQAVANRMEMLDLELKLASDAASIALERNRALPLLSLDYSYRVNGLGASGQDSFRTLERNDYADWSLGLNAEVPIGNEQAKSRIREAILRRLQRLGSKEARELAIRQEVLAAIDQIEASWQRILAARQSVILNTRTLQAEQRQFDVGASTSTNVLDAAANLADAQSAEVRAIGDYQIAQVDLAFATGTLLGAGKVELTDVGRPSLDQEDPIEQIGGETPAATSPVPVDAGGTIKSEPAPQP